MFFYPLFPVIPIPAPCNLVKVLTSSQLEVIALLYHSTLQITIAQKLRNQQISLCASAQKRASIQHKMKCPPAYSYLIFFSVFQFLV